MNINFTEEGETVKVSLNADPGENMQDYLSAVNGVLFGFWNYLNRTKKRKNIAQAIPTAPEYFNDRKGTYLFPSQELRKVRDELSERFREAETDDEDITQVYQAFADGLESFE